MKTLLMSIAIICISFCSCSKDEQENEIAEDNRVHVKIQLYQKNSITKEYYPFVNGKIYFYYDKDPYFYTYVSDGMVKLESSTMLPDTMLITDRFGKINSYLDKRYYDKLSTFLVEEENLVKDRIVSVNYILPNHKELVSTIYMIDE